MLQSGMDMEIGCLSVHVLPASEGLSGSSPLLSLINNVFVLCSCHLLDFFFIFYFVCVCARVCALFWMDSAQHGGLRSQSAHTTLGLNLSHLHPNV